MAVCKSLGENISMNQVKAMIEEVDDDGSGEIEWEEYLLIMGKKRNDAMKKGSGLFQYFSKKVAQVAKKKQDQINKEQLEKEKLAKQSQEVRELAVKRAKIAKEEEKKLIAIQNEKVRLAALERLKTVEIEKDLEIIT